MAGFASYKGRVYQCRFRGATRYGERAKLAFLDGSQEFWVPAAAAPACDTPARLSRKRTGCSCGSFENEYYDWYCDDCRFDELDQ